MDKAIEWKDVALSSLNTMWIEITKIFPNVLGALVILIVGWFVTKLVVRIVKKTLKIAKANRLDDKLNEIELVEGKNLNFDTVKIVSKFIKWLMYIMLLIMISDVLNLTMISQQISNLLSYLPQLFSALVIFTIGLILANVIKKGLQSFFEC